MKNKIILIVFSVILVFVIALFLIFNFVLYPKKYSNYISEYSSEYNIESALVYAIIKAESDFDKTAKSSAGAIGLMQILPSTGRYIASALNEQFEENNLFEPKTNIRYGCYYLRYLFDRFDDTHAVICAYNAGEGVVRKWLDEDGKLDETKISYSETKTYFRKVKDYYAVYKNSKICF